MSQAERESETGARDARVVLMTAPSRGSGLELARALVAERLIACVNVVDGVTSVYRWEGHVEEAREVLMVAKTVRGRVEQLEQRLVELHPYDVPEFVVLAPEHVEGRFAAWLGDAVGPPTPPESVT
ncbi:MAG: periplasmic divalent cation tolerance protein [Chlamydiales bacterium]